MLKLCGAQMLKLGAQNAKALAYPDAEAFSSCFALYRGKQEQRQRRNTGVLRCAQNDDLYTNKKMALVRRC
jgi:hypothetical protein